MARETEIRENFNKMDLYYRNWGFFTIDLEKPRLPSSIMTINRMEDKIIFQNIRDMDFSFFAEEGKTYELGLVAFRSLPDEKPSQIIYRLRDFLSDKLKRFSFVELLRVYSEQIRLINLGRFSIEDFAGKYDLCNRGKLDYGNIELSPECQISFDSYREDGFKWYISLPIFSMSNESLDSFF